MATCDPFYKTKAWEIARLQCLHDYGWRCSNCEKSLVGLGRGAHVHHRKELNRSPALATEPLNLLPLCRSCHNKLEPRTGGKATEKVNRARPILPKPNCRVMLVCGPVGSGKSSYVATHKGPDDTVLDFDAIARELGYGRERASLVGSHVAEVLEERNRRMRALVRASDDHVAWVILLAPSPALRSWWCRQLHVAPDDMVLLVPSKDELRRRILSDPTRSQVIALHLRLLDQWFEREHTNDPGFLSGKCDVNGFPTDPLHPWSADHGTNELKFQ